jgi:FkbM family methyltransferase
MRVTAGILRSLIVYWRPGRQRGLRRLYAPFAGPGDLVFDVGAHLGDRSAAFAALGARVVALEPNPDLVPWLHRMVGGRDRVTIQPEAVGRKPGTARIALSDAYPTLSTLAEEWRGSIADRNRSFQGVRWEREVEVPVTTLDALIEQHGEPRFCKIDVEGFEAEVLAGLSCPVDALSIEFVRGGLEIAAACVDRLQSLAPYRFNAIAGEGRRFELAEWVGATEILKWIQAGAAGVSSGDLYARRAHPRGEGVDSHVG